MSTAPRGVALVTGAGTGIGRAVALALADRGHRVLAVGRRSEPLETLAAEAGAGVISAHALDVADEGAVSDLLASTPGRLDVVVASAGVFARGPVADLALDDWERQVRVNLTGAFLTLQAAVRRMRDQERLDDGRGHVFTLNSGAGVVGFPTGSAYAASKHGLRGLVESLRGEVAGTGIKLTDLVVSATVESEMSAGRDVATIPPATVAHTVLSCLDLGGAATWDRVDLGQLRD
ncbi:SDR family oxidoreductase [Nocardioides pantholopis]|uniref:SDR family oxidoreductase n=1 Tax=Nocardioides pantholopis TaxID=2483798 RepID=UPI0013DE43FA|nr:SDR family oxidoreductase [Nocardioides pantholopis]